MAETGTLAACDAEVVSEVAEPAALVVEPPRGALPARASAVSESERLEEVENDIYVKNLDIVQGMTRFAEVTPEMEEPPMAWVEQMGAQKALETFRIAKASWMAPKDAPVALTAANKIVTNLAKARATRDAGRQGLQLNVLAVFPTQTQQYEELVVGDD